MKQPKVSIILINWNGLKDTVECLGSLSKISYSNYRILLIDNGSEDSESQYLLDKYLGSIEVIRLSRNIGYIKASNYAFKYLLKEEKPDYILQLDNDTIVDPNFLTELVKVAELRQSIGIVGAKIYHYDKPTQLQFVGEDINLWTGDVSGMSKGLSRILGRPEFDGSEDKYDVAHEVDFYSSWCTLIKRGVFERVGLLDEKFFFGWEDIDFCMRAKKAGFKIVYVPASKIWHKWKSATKLDGQLQYWGPKTRFYFMRKHANLAQRIVFYTYFFGLHIWLATAYYALWTRRPRLLKPFYKGVIEGVLNK